MRERFTEGEQKLIESYIELFILLPNPELKSKKDVVMKVTYQTLFEELNKY